MEKESKGAIAQKRYRNKLKDINETNAQFMAFASEHAPWLIEKFFTENKVSNINESKTEIYYTTL